MSRKHTPGPWTVEWKPPSRWEIRGAAEEDVALAKTLSPGVAQANARLIAAAPDLLSAAHATLKLWKKHGMGDNHHESDRIFDALVAAIAKAEGK